MTLLAQAAESPPAGGADPGEAILVTVAAAIVTAAIIGPLFLYKAGRFAPLERLSEFSERVSGLPGWAALPGAITGGALVIAVFGMYWDISLHIDNGRDEGPLANPAHYFILAGLYGVFIAGLIGAALPKGPTRTSIEILPGWHAPIGAIMIAVCGAASLSAFPLDDMWHRIFGQDVTLYGPTHLMLIGGAVLSVLGAWALQVEGETVGLPGGKGPNPAQRRWFRAREIGLAGAFLIALSTFQAEFDFSVPQFSLWLQPILIMMAAGIALVAVRIRIGPGGALFAVGFYSLVRGLLALSIGPVFGQTVPTFPLYLVEALVVEGVAYLWLRRDKPAAERPITFGAVCGLGIGTIGLAGEWLWNQTWVVNEWVPSLFPEGAILGFVAAVAGGVLGGFVGRTLTPGTEHRESIPRPVIPIAAAVAVGVIAFAIPLEAGSPVRADFDLAETTVDGERAVTGTVTLDPPDAAEDAYWFQATSWQGGGSSHSQVQQLREVSPGTYELTQPIPVEGTWKTTLRLHDGRRMAGLPIFLPRDEAIPAPEVSPPLSESRAFILDKENLQRELKDDVPGWLSAAAYLAVGLLAFGLIALNAWGLRRLEARCAGPEGPHGGDASVEGHSEETAKTGRGSGVKPSPTPRSA
jgi:hypothetical protein